ncbi:MAG: hypothetical protein CVU39_13325 [Chloroflexi bacterium HGW-Chloroflexi-10]|nr:MAG: hypothetical protein CVU39_13325 [Chloroflexi bacterium HGW-Chloroflexi-10]
MNKLPGQCPICHSDLEVTRVYCPHCDTAIEGHFAPSANPFGILNKEQMNFLMTFIRCEGRFNRMEEELNLSYPTLRNRLQEILKLLGFESKADDPLKLTPDERLRILDALATGEISADEAQVQLSGRKNEG